MTATKFQPGDDTHLSLLMAPHSLNFVTGADHAALLAYGRDVFAAGRDSKCLAQIEEPAPAQAVQTAPQIKLSAAVRGVGVVDDCDTALAVYFTAVPRKEDIRALHDALTKESSPQAAPALEAPAGFISVAAYDRLHAHCESLAARILAFEDAHAVEIEPMTRYCPGCGSVGPVDYTKHRDCCPDGGQARMIPEKLAQKCHDTFQIAVAGLQAEPAAVAVADLAAAPGTPPLTWARSASKEAHHE